MLVTVARRSRLLLVCSLTNIVGVPTMSVIEKWQTLRGFIVDAIETTDHLLDSMEADLHKEKHTQSDFTEDDLSYLMFVYDLERGMHDNEGSIIGPYQFSKIAWSEAGEGDWATNALDPVMSAKAALKFRDINYERFKRLFPGRPYTKAIAYLYHNQGPSAAASFLSTGVLKFPKQSKAALQVFDRIRA